MNEHWTDMPADRPDDAARLVLAGADTIGEEQAGLVEQWRTWTAQYHERMTTGFEPADYSRIDEASLLGRPVTLPVTRQIVDTIVSKLVVHSPRPRFLPCGASEGVLERARLMEKAVTAVLRSNDVWALGASAMRDAGVTGTGVLVVDSLDGKIRIRRMHPSRVLVDDRACLDSREPYEAYVLEWLPLREIKRRWGDADWESVQTDGPAELELVKVVTSWVADSEYAIAAAGGVMLERGPWKGPVPLVPIVWHEDTLGWHGTGCAEVVQGIHDEVNALTARVQDNTNILAVPFILKEKGSDVDDEHLLSNELARMIEYVGTPPQIVQPPAIAPQVLELISAYYAKAFETEGVSMLSAAARKPEGLNSGVAIRTYMDIESQRLTELQRRWENMYVRLAQQIVREAARIGSAWTVLAATGGRAEKIKWSDAVLAEDEYVVQVWPASSLPQSPAGRLERVIEMLNSGMVDALEARTLLDWPDLEKSDMLAAAERDDLHRLFEKFLDGAEYEPPLEQQDLRAGVLLARRYWLRGRLDGVPEERLLVLETWMREAADMVQAAMTPPQAPMGAFPPQAELPAQ